MSGFRCVAVLASGVALLLGTPSSLDAWGDHGHRMIGLVAAEKLPDDMPPFFRQSAERLSYLNPEPDRWKNRDEIRQDAALVGGTSPDHYINMDLMTSEQQRSMLRAPDRLAFADSVRRAGFAPSAMGFLPFTMLEYAQKLRNDFRMWRIAPDSTVRSWIEQRIIEDAGILGHFVADASNPHHVTRHHNGWVGDNPRGYTTDNRFHSRFESQYVQAHIKAADVRAVATAAPQVYPALRDAIVNYLQASHAQLEPLYVLDGKSPFTAETTTPEQKAFAVARLAAGAQMLRDVWYTAWITSAPSTR